MAYNAAVKSCAPAEQIVALDPGRHQVALGAIRTAIGHVETIMGAAADAQRGRKRELGRRKGEISLRRSLRPPGQSEFQRLDFSLENTNYTKRRVAVFAGG